MSRTLRYGLASVVLIVGTMGAFYFHRPGETAELAIRRVNESRSESIDRADKSRQSINNPALAAQQPVPKTNTASDPFALTHEDSSPSKSVIPVAGLLKSPPKPPRTEVVSQKPAIEDIPPAPEFELGFAPIKTDDSWTIVPARHPESSTATQASEPERKVIPARKTRYLPRAFRRSLDGPSAKLPHAQHNDQR